MLEINDTVLEAVVGGSWGGRFRMINTNNSTVKLYNFSVKGDGGLAIVVTQSIK